MSDLAHLPVPAGTGDVEPVEVEAWQRVAAVFLLAHTGATRSAYAGEARSYLH